MTKFKRQLEGQLGQGSGVPLCSSGHSVWMYTGILFRQVSLSLLDSVTSGGLEQEAVIFKISGVFLAMPQGMHDLISLTRDQTWSLNHWTTREVPKNSVLFIYFFLFSFTSTIYVLNPSVGH